MYQDGCFIGIVEQAQRREFANTSGKIKTDDTLFSGKKVKGEIKTTHSSSYEFKLQGHSEIFRTNNEYVIHNGDKVILRATKK